MLETNRYSVINIRRYLNSDNPKLGESRLLQVLSGFSCLRNPDAERFMKKSSVEFTKRISRLHILYGAGRVFYPCIETFNSKGRNSKQYCKEKVAACQ